MMRTTSLAAIGVLTLALALCGSTEISAQEICSAGIVNCGPTGMASGGVSCTAMVNFTCGYISNRTGGKEMSANVNTCTRMDNFVYLGTMITFTVRAVATAGQPSNRSCQWRIGVAGNGGSCPNVDNLCTIDSSKGLPVELLELEVE